MSKSFTKRNEGFRKKIYSDTEGNPTVGWGTHLYVGRNMPAEVLEILFNSDYEEAAKYCDNMFPDLTPTRRDAIVDIIYALGLPEFLGFKNTIKALHNLDYNTAAHEVLNSIWARKVGQRAQRISYMLRYDKYMGA